MSQQGGVRIEATQPLRTLAGTGAQQIQGERDRRRAPREIVVQPRIQAFVAKVDLGRQREQHDVELEVRQREVLAEQPRRMPWGQRSSWCVGSVLVRGPQQRLGRATGEQAVDFVLADHEPEVGIGARRGPIAAHELDCAAQAIIETAQSSANHVE